MYFFATRFRIAISFMVAILVLALFSTSVSANGRVTRFDLLSADPFLISVGTIPETPVAGNLHLTMKVMEKSTSTFVIDAMVIVSGTGPSERATGVGPIVATNNSLDPTFYDVNFSVDEIGKWVFTISIEADPGEADVIFEIEVVESSPVPGIIALAVLITLVTILGLSIRAFVVEQKKNRSKSIS